jgi:pSer/pThr/pTyr-binding forkhead associated (FHA) protein
MKVKLVPIRSRNGKQTIVLEQLPVVFGRDPDAGIYLDDSWVSRRHCEIDEIDGALIVRDLQSRNGTFVNGCRITEEELAPGDKLTIGIVSYEVQYRRSRVRLWTNGKRQAAHPEKSRGPIAFLQRFSRHADAEQVAGEMESAPANAPGDKVPASGVEH